MLSNENIEDWKLKVKKEHVYICIYNMSIRRKVHPRLAIQNGKKARNTDARMVQIVRR